MFALDKKLVQDTSLIGQTELNLYLLMNNSLFPWVIIVPKVKDIAELFDLRADHFQTLSNEIYSFSKKMKNLYNADKMNIANLGNVVSQLHIHVIARFENDQCWPEPIWNKGTAKYEPDELKNTITKISKLIP